MVIHKYFNSVNCWFLRALAAKIQAVVLLPSAIEWQMKKEWGQRSEGGFHWLGSVLCVCALTLMVGWQEGHAACKNLCPLSPKMFFQNKWRKVNFGRPSKTVLLLQRSSILHTSTRETSARKVSISTRRMTSSLTLVSTYWCHALTWQLTDVNWRWLPTVTSSMTSCQRVYASCSQRTLRLWHHMSHADVNQ